MAMAPRVTGPGVPTRNTPSRQEQVGYPVTPMTGD